ncbi:MAG: phosphatase PAP2 family protein [Burkholderiales bacterium]|jgi:membrane-associated phospholipid phosphatase|nr:phosphatase PAP2 family protein [Burkholderiales bacterium]
MGIESLWVHVTDLGDSAVLLPLALVIVLWLGSQCWRAAAFWAALFCADGAGVILSKLLFMGWGLHPEGFDFTGLSGHSALSMLVFPTLGQLLGAGRRASVRWALPLLGALLAAVIVVSRLKTNFHTPIEAVSGALWGGVMAVLALWRLPRQRINLHRRAWFLPIAILLPLVLNYGEVFPSYKLLENIACQLSGRARPYTRADLTHPGG